MKKIAAVLAGAALVPMVAGAQELENFKNFIDAIADIVNLLIPIVVAIAVLYFFWGLAQFILNSGNDDARTEGRNKMIWGIVALFVIVSIWGLVGFLGDALGVEQGGSAPVPGVEGEVGGDGEEPDAFGR